jgi:pimeloyl-ACP methyl ester carboxylesterase
MEGLRKKLETIFEASGGKKVDIVSHCMGGLLVKSFLALHHEIFEKYVHSWITVAAPFEGAPGCIMDSLLTGFEFFKGWQQEFFVHKWSMHQLMIECPSVYELMAWAHFNWSVLPELRLWHIHADKDGNEKVVMEAYGPNSYVDVMSAALEENMVFTCFPTLFLMKCLMLRAQFSKARSRNLSFS